MEEFGGMVKFMSFRGDGIGNQKRLRAVELVGPAGAGKTTLCNSLIRCSDRIHFSNFPDVRRVENVPFFLFYGLQVVPVSAHIARSGDRQLCRREFAWLSILSGWPNVLKKELNKNNHTIILDQGPVYLLTETREFGPNYLRGKKAAKLWMDLYARWVGVLDVIIWLDADDADLIKRIRTREKEHIVKDGSIETISAFLARYRDAYERTISNLSANHSSLKVLRIDTSQCSPDEITDWLLVELDV